MPPRLGGKKSRTGCHRCKVRRVKCDETHPECTNCTKHGVPCEYPDLFTIANVSIRSEVSRLPLPDSDASASASSTNLPVGPASPYSDRGDIDSEFDVQERRILELQLLHHYMTNVTYTFPACIHQKFKDIWSIDSVRLGFEHSFLLNAILAISSLHLLTDTGPKNYFYAEDTDELSVARLKNVSTSSYGAFDFAKAHRIYLNQAIREQREAISYINPMNADAVFLASVLLSYQALRLIPDRPDTLYSPPTQWLSMAKAISTIAEAARPQVQNDSIVEMIISMNADPDFRNRLVIFNPLNRQPFESLLDWDRNPEPDFDGKTKDTYEQTLAYIGGVYRAVLDKESPRAILKRLIGFGVMVPAHYMTLLAKGRPRALAILAYFFALSVAVDEHWLFRGAAGREVNGIRTLLPQEWEWAMEWPISMVRLGYGGWLDKMQASGQ